MLDQGNEDAWQEGDEIELKNDILDEDQLKKLCQNLPDDRYRIYLILEDGTKQVVLDFNIRDQQLVEVDEDDAEYEFEESHKDDGGQLDLNPPDESPAEPLTENQEKAPRLDSDSDLGSFDSAAYAAEGSLLAMGADASHKPAVKSQGSHVFVVGKLALKIDSQSMN